MKLSSLFFLFLFSLQVVSAQNLEDLLDDTLLQIPKTELVTSTFKSVQLINSHTTKSPVKDELVFLISHRFGYINSGFSNFFGLDNATARFGFEYGITDKLALGFGRSTYKSNYDFFGKYALLRQTKGSKNIPFTLSVLGVANISSAKWPDDGNVYLFAHRMSYTAQFLLARKFNRNLSLQLMPTFIHRNLVEKSTDQNDVFSLGAGGRVKVSNWVALTFEYHYLLPGETANQYENPLSVGVDIETGGHVFQLFFTNTAAVYDAAYITETIDRWRDGNIRFGFNISRTF